MDNTQIAAIRGGFFNYLKNNPTIAAALFSGYDNSAIWNIGSGDPPGTSLLVSYYFDSVTGNIWYCAGGLTPQPYQYISCLFDTRSTRKIRVDVDVTDLNGGVSPEPNITISLPTLAANEYISNIFVITNTKGADSGSIGDLVFNLLDGLYGNTLTAAMPGESVDALTISCYALNSMEAGTPASTYPYNIVASATDLTTLTYGNWSFIIEISTIP